MNILVTGGLGTIGAGLVTELRSRDHHVVSCDLLHQPDELAFSITGTPEPRQYVRCDVAEYRQLERLFEHCGPFDVVYHCAAEFGRWNGEDFYEDLWRTNVIGTKNILRLQVRTPFRLVHFSSSEVYGDWPGIMVETVTDRHEVKLLNDYAMTKWVNEMQIRNAGTDTVVVRLFNTYGPGEFYAPYRSVNCRFLFCALKGLPWTVYRGHRRTSTYLADAVRTLATIAERFHPGETYNIGGPTSHTIEELADVVLQVTSGNPSLIQFKGEEPQTTKAKEVDIGKAVRDLDHLPSTSLIEGMQRTADWMRTVYDVP